MNETYTIRNYHPRDFNRYADMNISAGKREWFGSMASHHTLTESLKRPDYSPEENLFIAECGEIIAGYVNVIPERIIGRAIMDCYLHPEHRSHVLAERLFGQALLHTGSISIPLAHACVGENNRVIGEALAGLGCDVVRKFVNMRLDMADFRLSSIKSGVFRLRRPKAGEEAIIAGIQNRCFDGTWGYNPNTAVEIAHYMRLFECTMENIILLCDGDRPVASCWTTIYPQDSAGNSGNIGRIHMLGVDPDYRGRGIGREALLAGLVHLKTSGVNYVDLTADSENEVALSLYVSAGFRESSASLWHEKRVS
ncbi:GNAT family N-acetyltransferase [Chloroflexota bacterium]